jgi:hypothetical protein
VKETLIIRIRRRMEGEGDPSGFKGKDQEENISHGRGVFA